MSDNYSVTITVTISVLAESEENAEKLALTYMQEADLINSDSLSVSVYRTPNQAMMLKRLAVNY